MSSSEWSSDVCASDLQHVPWRRRTPPPYVHASPKPGRSSIICSRGVARLLAFHHVVRTRAHVSMHHSWRKPFSSQSLAELIRNMNRSVAARSEEHTSEPQSLMRISYAVFCLKKKKTE